MQDIGRNTGNQRFLLFPQCFIPFQEPVSSWCSICCVYYVYYFKYGKSNFAQVDLVKGKFTECQKHKAVNGLLRTESGLNIIQTFNLKVPVAANWKGFCLQNTSKPHFMSS